MPATILDFWQQTTRQHDANGELIGDVLAPCLVVKVDRESDGQNVRTLLLPFADHAGLEAEFNTGTATTVMQTALASEGPDISWILETLTDDQRDARGDQITLGV